MLKACFCMFCCRNYTCSRCIFTTKHKEILDKHWKRVHGVKRRCGWGCQFVYPEVDSRRYQKHVDKRNAGQPFKEGIVIGKGKRATGSAVEKVASVAIPTDSAVDIPDCFGSTDPLHLCNSSWEEEPEGGFIELVEEAGIPKIPLSPVKPRINENGVEVINGIPSGEMKWKLIKVDIPKHNLAIRDPRVKRM